jgi:hypothetical protein
MADQVDVLRKIVQVESEANGVVVFEQCTQAECDEEVPLPVQSPAIFSLTGKMYFAACQQQSARIIPAAESITKCSPR